MINTYTYAQLSNMNSSIKWNNRILLPQELRLYAGLEKHLCLIGQGKKLEIWNQEAWNSQREKWFTENMIDGDLPEKLKTLVL